MQHVRRPWKAHAVTAFERWRVLRGDTVEVIRGKSKGGRGVVKKVLRDRNMVLVEGIVRVDVAGGAALTRGARRQPREEAPGGHGRDEGWRVHQGGTGACVVGGAH